ncbi:hypothetical protein PLCT2_02308 [Planctomycetaceae bacterium]|nr:hypothetical protein PLCT2_02308 [Planctomycetaceae bacterium]
MFKFDPAKILLQQHTKLRSQIHQLNLEIDRLTQELFAANLLNMLREQLDLPLEDVTGTHHDLNAALHHRNDMSRLLDKVEEMQRDVGGEWYTAKVEAIVKDIELILNQP